MAESFRSRNVHQQRVLPPPDMLLTAARTARASVASMMEAGCQNK
ncbi:hypothetical protein [Arthrobacter globiformis]|nr:hypothetical protein [Arthrobacter globiformis]